MKRNNLLHIILYILLFGFQIKAEIGEGISPVGTLTSKFTVSNLGEGISSVDVLTSKFFNIYAEGISSVGTLTSYPGPGFSIIKGRVLNESGQPMVNAEVLLTGNNVSETTFTDNFGDYFFAGLASGNYNVSVRGSTGNYLSYNLSVSGGIYIQNLNFAIPTGNQYFAITSELKLYANNITTIQPDYIKATGNVNINGILYFSGEVTVDKRINNYYPVVSGNGTLSANNIQGQNYDIASGNFKYVAVDSQLIPTDNNHLLNATWLLYGFGTKIGTLEFGLVEEYVKSDFLLLNLPVPLKQLIDYVIKDDPLGPMPYPSKIAGGKTYSRINGVGESLDFTIRNPIIIGGVAVDTFNIHYNTALHTLGGKLYVTFPGLKFKGKTNNKNIFEGIPIDIKNNEGEKIYSTDFNSLIELQKIAGSKFLGFGLEIEFVEGAINRFIFAVSTKIPLDATGLFITKIAGGVDDWSTSNWKAIANVNIETGLELPIIGPPVGLKDFGVEIAPWTYFQGGGIFQIFKNNVANGYLIYDGNEKNLKLTGALNLADIIMGNVNTSLKWGEFIGSANATIKTPSDLPFFLNWAENQILASSLVEVHNFTMQTQVQLWKLSLAQKVEFGKQTFPWFHYYLGLNLNSLVQIWKGKKGNEQAITFQVPANTPQLFVVAGNDINLFDFTLLGPTGKVYNSTNTSYTQFDSSKQTLMLVDKPEDGEWQFVTSQTGNITVETMGFDQQPTTLLKAPGTRGTESNVINLKFNDYSDTLEVEVFYDSDNKNYDGVFIKKFELVNNADLNFLWENNDVSNGEYFIYCRIDDGQNAPVLHYAPGSIVVNNSAFNAVPQNLTVVQVGDSIKAEWDIPSSATTSMTIIYYKNITSGRVDQAVVADSDYAYLKNLEYGQAYEFWALLVDVDNTFGPKSNVQNLVFVNHAQNNPPYFTLKPDSSWIFIEGETKNFNLTASDADGNPITFNVSQNPLGMTVNGSQLTWTPTYDDRGAYNILLTASDGTDVDSVHQEVIVYTQEQMAVKVDFNSHNLYENDNMFIKLNNYKSPNQFETVTLRNKMTNEEVTVNCRRVDDFQFIGEFDLSYAKKSNVTVRNGDTLEVIYNNGKTEYSTYAIYDSTEQSSDNVPPAAISDLQILSAGQNQIEVRWTATGDDGNIGEALKYDIRYSYSPILSESDYLTANLYNASIYPSQNGQNDSVTIHLKDLINSADHDTIYFAIKAEDEMQNRSTLSNCEQYHYLIVPDLVNASVQNVYNINIDWSGLKKESWGLEEKGNVTIDHYKVHRKRDENYFVEIADSVETSTYVDTLFSSLDGTYQYGIQAVYDGGESDTAFSNSVILNRFADIRILCAIEDSTNYQDVNLSMEGLDTVYHQIYSRITNPTGLIIIDNVYQSNYILEISKTGYPTIIDTITVTDTTNQFAYMLKNSITRNIKLAVEGFYNSSLNQLNINDTVTVYLRNAASPYSIVDSAISVIDSLTFTGQFNFKNINDGTYYMVIKHRNSIETWSKNGGELLIKGSTANYSFVDSSSRAYGNNMKLINGNWCIFSGDVNQDGIIDSTDLTIIGDDAFDYSTGYRITDLTGDGFVDLKDLTVCDDNAFNGVQVIKPQVETIAKPVSRELIIKEE